MKAAAHNADLETLRVEWERHWPEALALWSRYLKLHDPAWCFTADDEKREQLSGSFAMIRLNDHSIVISLPQIVENGLQGFAREVLAHEIGHHVYCPADLTDNARLLARIRAGLPTKEHLAAFVSNLYSDLLINDHLQRIAELNIAGVYLKLGSDCREKMWRLYMRIYELLWKLPRGELARGKFDERLNQDAQLGARLIRSYAKDWLDGAGRFAALCLPYLIEDENEKTKLILTPWLDTRCAGSGAIPDGLAEIDGAEINGAIHPAEDPELSGIEADAAKMPDSDVTGAKPGRRDGTGIKTAKQYRQPFEYSEVLKAAGVDVDERDIVARYYRERALPHLVPFPVRRQPEATEPIPEGLDVWDIASPVEEIDWLGSLLTSPQVVPGVTTRERLVGTSPGTTPETAPIDLYLGVDCSGSMGNPASRLSYPVLAGAIIALSALRSGSKVKVVLSGEPGRTLSTDGFIRDQKLVMRTLTSYLGTGYSFGIHRLQETFGFRPETARPVHILVVSDNDMFTMLENKGDGRQGWDVAREAVERAGGGATFVLELPGYVRGPGWKQNSGNYIERIKEIGWNVNIVTSMEELVEFARQFCRDNYVTATRGNGRSR
jgi:hypothetical protein